MAARYALALGLFVALLATQAHAGGKRKDVIGGIRFFPVNVAAVKQGNVATTFQAGDVNIAGIKQSNNLAIIQGRKLASSEHKYSYEIPKVYVPKVEVHVPKVEVPPVHIPKVEIPKVHVPKIEVPKVHVPKIDVHHDPHGKRGML